MSQYEKEEQKTEHPATNSRSSVAGGGINNNSSITLGIGIKKSIINVDYAYISNNSNLPFNSSHCITLGINLNK